MCDMTAWLVTEAGEVSRTPGESRPTRGDADCLVSEVIEGPHLLLFVVRAARTAFHIVGGGPTADSACKRPTLSPALLSLRRYGSHLFLRYELPRR
jgi:hypothetical protein